MSDDEGLKESTLNFANFLKPLNCNKCHGITRDECNSVHMSDKKVSSKLKNNDSHKKKES